MAYRVDMTTKSVEADSADEVRQLLGLRRNSTSGIDPSPGPGPTPPKKRRKKRKKRTPNDTPAETEAALKKTRGAKRKTAKRKTAKRKTAKRKTGAGGWGPAKAEAKRQGRTDVAAVRAELAAAKT
jgi:hypothetical protein